MRPGSPGRPERLSICEDNCPANGRWGSKFINPRSAAWQDSKTSQPLNPQEKEYFITNGGFGPICFLQFTLSEKSSSSNKVTRVGKARGRSSYSALNKHYFGRVYYFKGWSSIYRTHPSYALLPGIFRYDPSSCMINGHFYLYQKFYVHFGSLDRVRFERKYDEYTVSPLTRSRCQINERICSFVSVQRGYDPFLKGLCRSLANISSICISQAFYKSGVYASVTWSFPMVLQPTNDLNGRVKRKVVGQCFMEYGTCLPSTFHTE